MGLLARDTPTTTYPARAVTASARRIDPGDRKAAKPTQRPRWQQEAWDIYDAVGEVKFASNVVANTLSRLRLYVACQPDPEQAPIAAADQEGGSNVDPGLAQLAGDVLARLNNAEGGTSEMLRALGLNLEVPGEAYLLGLEAQDEQRDDITGEVTQQARAEQWSIRSTDELRASEGGWKLHENGEGTGTDVPADAFMARIWQRHPRYSGQPDSFLRGVLNECTELLLLSRAVRSAARSRLNAGLLLVPSELSFGKPNPEDGAATDGNAGDDDGDPFSDSLIDQAIDPVEDDGDPAALVPMLVRGKAEFLHPDVFRRIDLSRTVSADEAGQRNELLRRIAQGLNVPPEVILGMAQANHWCVDDATEVLTADGWRHHDDLQVGDLVLALDHDTGTSRWSPVRDVYRAQVTDEPMVGIRMAGHSSLTTPNHRWPVAGRWRTTETLREQDRLLVAAPSEAPAEAKWDDALVELVGWFWTEGNIGTGGRRVSIAQSHTVNPDRVARIRAALVRLFGPPRRGAWREAVQANTSSYGGPVTVFRLSVRASAALLAVAPGKRPTVEWVRSLTTAQLALFIDVSMQGDGQHYRAGRLDCWAARPDMLDALELAGVLAGYAVTRSDGGHRVNLARKPTVRPVKAHRHALRSRRPGLMTAERYTGTIWCPVTDESTWCARRDGTVYFTGNTAWQVDRTTFTAHIEPRAVSVVGALTHGFLWPLLEAAGADPKALRRLFVWYDESEAVSQPNRAQDAKDAHKAMVISDQSFRQALTFGDGDAPSPEEIARRIGMNRGIFDGNITEALLMWLLPQVAEQIVTVRDRNAERSADNAIEVAESTGDDTPTAGAPADTPEPQTDPTGGEAALIAALLAVGRGEHVDTEAVVRHLAGRWAPVTAASRRERNPGEVLAQLDRSLVERVHVAVEAAVSRALERAGNVLTSRTQGNAAVAASVRAAPRSRRAATLGRPLVAAMGITDAQLLGDDPWDSLRGQVDAWMAATADEAVAVLDATWGPIPEATVAATQARLAAARGEAWAWLADQLTVLATARLYDPDPAAPPLGEHDPTMTVPVGLVRQAMARAGGVTGAEAVALPAAGSRLVAQGGTQPAGGLATGEVVLLTADELGAGEPMWEWQWGSLGRPRTAFDGHRRLDGLQFASYQDEALAVSGDDGWLGVSFYAPGDHSGCCCFVAPVFPNFGAKLRAARKR